MAPKITAIKSQQHSQSRFSVYLDGKYAFSMSQTALVDNSLKIGQVIERAELKKLKNIADQDKLYFQTLDWSARRLHSQWEVETYLKRKHASPALVQDILNKLSKLDLIDDSKFAELLVQHIQSQSPASRRKIINGLKQKRVKQAIIDEVLASSPDSDQSALAQLIELKRHKYPDKTKLIAYLARQGFNYGDIKSALDIDSGD